MPHLTPIENIKDMIPMSHTSQPREHRHMSQTAFNRYMPVAFTAPLLIVFVILTLIPLTNTIWYSFTDYNGYTSEFSFVGLSNYVSVLTDPSLLGGLGFTIMFTVASTALVTVFAIWLAVVLNKQFLGRNFARSLFFFLGVPAQAILGLVWQYIFSPLKCLASADS
ncbi:carbohydrate ABC transporter permease [Bifidobacterium ramosum]|nr:sugar ABC transporter permease [Bifidobacterium ramosum]